MKHHLSLLASFITCRLVQEPWACSLEGGTRLLLVYRLRSISYLRPFTYLPTFLPPILKPETESFIDLTPAVWEDISCRLPYCEDLAACRLSNLRHLLGILSISSIDHVTWPDTFGTLALLTWMLSKVGGSPAPEVWDQGYLNFYKVFLFTCFYPLEKWSGEPN